MEQKLTQGQLPTHLAGRTSAEIEHVLEARIRDGVYALGAQIQTVRDAAHEWHVDKNTVARAYKSLERKGLLKLVRGRGAFVMRREPLLGSLDGRWLHRLEELLTEASHQSLGRMAVLSEINRTLDRIYHEGRRQLAFVECNMGDIQSLSTRLAEAVGRPLEGMLLEDLLARPESVAAQYDLIITTFYHLGEVRQALGESAAERVIGVHATPTHEALHEIARVQALMIGFVFDVSRAADEFVHMIKSYHPAATILPVTIRDTSRIQSLINKADAIIVTQLCYERLLQLKPAVPVILLTMTIDPQSVDFLRKRIEELEPTV
jgi:GntR family transcriptional regulator